MTRQDLTGQRFGKLTVIKNTQEKDKQGSFYWLCQCDCGKQKRTTRNRLSHGTCTSCGCRTIEKISKMAKERKRPPLKPGDVYGNLTIIKEITENKPIKRGTNWQCLCVCGNTTVRNRCYLKRKDKPKSCGCVKNRHLITNRPPGDSGLVKVFHSYKKQAERRGLSFALSKEEFNKITQGNCHYCGKPPSNSTGPQWQNASKYKLSHQARIHGIYLYNGVDRVNNTEGYSTENCVACCTNCNFAKRTQTYSDFLKLVYNIYKNLNLGELKNEIPPSI